MLLLGGTSIVDFRMRIAQSELRQDLLPSFWSTCGLLIDGEVLMTARVDAISNSSARVERNGLEAVSLDKELTLRRSDAISEHRHPAVHERARSH